MSWRVIDSKGIPHILCESEYGFDIDADAAIQKVRSRYYVYKICDKHKVVCSGTIAHRKHLQEEHSY